jgi:hypothetical protein
VAGGIEFEGFDLSGVAIEDSIDSCPGGTSSDKSTDVVYGRV